MQARDDAREIPASKSRKANTFPRARKCNGSSEVTNNSADASSVKQRDESNGREN